MSSCPDVLELLPHRPPMLMLDRIVSLDGEGCVALKNISQAEPCFQGHFPQAPVFPGVLTLEALGQACAAWLVYGQENKLPILTGIDQARFFKRVLPGDQLRLSVRCIRTSKGFYTFDTAAWKGDEAACTAEMTLTLR